MAVVPMVHPGDAFSRYSSIIPGRKPETAHPDQAAAVDKAINAPSTHSTEKSHFSNNHSSCCCCCCCRGGGSTSEHGDEYWENKINKLEKHFDHELKKFEKEESLRGEYWDAFHKSLSNSIFERGNRIVQNAKKEGERILDEYYLNPPKSNKRHS